MSYDVTVSGEWINYTSNMAAMFDDFGVRVPLMHGRPRREVGAEIGEGLRKIVRARREDRVSFDAKYDPPNGWGSVDTGLRFLLQIYLLCFYEVPETVEVSW